MVRDGFTLGKRAFSSPARSWAGAGFTAYLSLRAARVGSGQRAGGQADSRLGTELPEPCVCGPRGAGSLPGRDAGPWAVAVAPRRLGGWGQPPQSGISVNDSPEPSVQLR